ncbi:SMC-Scp complex subunit ScpB [Candidatus Parvarchaeota archaeon]|nr:SMC-Scp complex subunit ScpB [Candidatus Parvarchaeota archaeon]
MTEEENLIQAALFISARPMPVSELSRLLGIAAQGYVESTVKKLAESYNSSAGALEIAFIDGKYIMRVKAAYLNRVKQFAQGVEISQHALKTLAYINGKPGIKKADLVKHLGASVYQDVFELVEKGFVVQRKAGRTSSLHTTEKFREYFATAAQNKEGLTRPEVAPKA